MLHIELIWGTPINFAFHAKKKEKEKKRNTWGQRWKEDPRMAQDMISELLGLGCLSF